MTDKPDAIAMLKADHDKVDQLFQDYEDAKGAAQKKKLARQICLELIVHTRIEEEIFYPACRGKVEDGKLDEGVVEHDGAKVLIAEIEAGGPEDDFFDAKVKVLAEQIRHHVKEEEKPAEGLFSKARKAGLDMDALGEAMRQRKEALMAELEDGDLPTPRPQSLGQVELR